MPRPPRHDLQELIPRSISQCIPPENTCPPDERPKKRLLAEYKKRDTRAFNDDGTGELQRPCSISVIDYGIRDGKYVCCCNGRDVENGAAGVEPVRCSTATEIHDIFPPNFFDEPCTWERRVRWIDIEGMNGEIVEFCLHLLGCDDLSAFLMLVDPKQRSMVLDLDCNDGVSVLVMALKSKLTAEAEELLAAEESDVPFYDVRDITEDETTSYLCRVHEGRQESLLITLQGGMEDQIFEEVQGELCEKSPAFCEEDAVYLLMRLVRASSDSFWGVLNYVDCAIESLQKDVAAKPGSEKLFSSARLLEQECGNLLERSEPFEATLFELCNEYLELVGPTQKAWRALAVQNQGMLARLKHCEQHARDLVGVHRDHLANIDHERQKRLEWSQGVMGLVLAVFSPLAFITAVYGMNFSQPDGNPGIPELCYGYGLKDPSDPSSGVIQTGTTGYGYFWILICAVSASVLLIYMALGLIKVPTPSWLTLRWVMLHLFPHVVQQKSKSFDSKER